MKLNQSTGTVKAITLVALSLLVALLALPGTTSAQSITGSISGSVVDESGGVIPGADVTVINEASKGVRRSVTNAYGFFAFASLPAATYTLSRSRSPASTRTRSPASSCDRVTAARCARSRSRSRPWPRPSR